MKIGILSPLSIGDFKKYLDPSEQLPIGLECTIITQLVEYYLEQGHEVLIATVTFGMHPPKVFRGKNLTLFVGNHRKYGKIRAITKFSSESNQMARFFRENPCDIYHAHWEYEYALAALKVDKSKTLVTLHDWPFAVYDLMHDYYRKKRLQMSLEVFDKAERFTCVSDYIYESFHEAYPEKRAEVVNNCMKKEAFFVGDKIRNETPIIAASNNGFIDLKNTKKIMEAFAIIRVQFPKAKLHMCGIDFQKGGVAEHWARENNCAEGIEFVGPIEHWEMVQLFRKADLLIHASKQEALSTVVIESMINKTPIVAGNKSGGIPSMLNHGDCGCLVNINDENEIAQKSIEILSNNELWSQYMEKAYLEATNKYTPEVIGEKYISIYKEVIGQN